MPRRGRIMLAGIPVHAIQRGNNRSACFVSHEDRAFYLFQLGRALTRFECELHAYCLMTNHVHLLLTPRGERSCAVLMKHMGQIYTQYFNRLYKRTGSLWEGRFRSCLVQTERYVLACYRYIELNPVRAGLVSHPSDYRWSSYAENALGRSAGLLTPHEELRGLGTDDDERRRVYVEFIGARDDAVLTREIRAITNGGYALGDEQFRRDMALALGRRVDRGAPGRPPHSEPQDGQTELVLPPQKNVVCP